MMVNGRGVRWGRRNERIPTGGSTLYIEESRVYKEVTKARRFP